MVMMMMMTKMDDYEQTLMISKTFEFFQIMANIYKNRVHMDDK